MDSRERERRAAQILAEEFWINAFARLEAAYVEAWKKGRTIEAREDTHRLLTLLDDLKNDLAQAAYGELERKRQKELEGRRQTLWPVRS